MDQRSAFFAGLGVLVATALFASDPAPPRITGITVSNNQKRVTWSPSPAIEQYSVFGSSNVEGPYGPTPGVVNGLTWSVTNSALRQFFQVGAMPLSSNALLTVNALNRLAYGPTPDELERVAAIGPQAYIDEQLAPAALPVDYDAYTVLATNSATLPPNTNWTFVQLTGAVSSSTLYMYLTGVGDVYIDDLQLKLINRLGDTNIILGPNVLVNGDFEQPLSTGWTVSTNLVNSAIEPDPFGGGGRVLHLVSTAAGTTQNNSVWQTVVPALPTANNQRCVFSFRYVQSAQSSLLTLRLSGNGTIFMGRNYPPPAPEWVYATATGRMGTSSNLYIYLNGRGIAYVDDVKLVRGTVPEVGANLLLNGDFETPLGPAWQTTSNFANSTVDTTVARSGNGSLRVVALAAGSGNNNAIFQGVQGTTNGGTYTVSFWYVPAENGQTITVRFSGAGNLTSNPDTDTIGAIRRRLDAGEDGVARLAANLSDLRAWHVQNAVRSPRQLLEVLLQFCENHFVTEHAKTLDYFDRFYDDFNLMDRIAADLEFRELQRWRQALLQPDCTFYDLLKISAESVSMIIYLDTVNSRGDGNNIANENWARELFELFCMGVDNGYDQNDIVAQSRAWTGWSTELVDAANVNNPHAAPSALYGLYPGNGYSAVSNRFGAWAFNFKPGVHGTNRAPLLSVWATNSTPTNLIALGPKIVPARFGTPWAGRPYQLVIPRRTGTNSIEDGYDVIRHLANLPMTMEYISVKLCRLFVHDDFPNPTTHDDLPEYGFYDYTNPNRSAEAELVRQCMVAWQNGTPRGNIRDVLRTIFNSDLFRSHGGSVQKVKTPLELTVSTIRALRSTNPDGTFTASTDGYSISGRSRGSGSAPLTRMGRMQLFDRDSPDGYPEAGAPWISAGTLAERVRYVQTTLMAAGDGAKGDGISGGNFNLTDPVALLKKKLPAGSWNNAGAVADYFLAILCPAEGAGNLGQYRNAAVNFLNTTETGAVSLFSGLNNTSAAYDTRVRGMVSMLMTLQRFQEQ